MNGLFYDYNNDDDDQHAYIKSWSIKIEVAKDNGVQYNVEIGVQMRNLKKPSKHLKHVHMHLFYL